MRRRLLILLLVNVLILIFLLNSVSTLASLLVEDASADAIHRAELPAPNDPYLNPGPTLIPKIIHQTYINESIPERWRTPQKDCIDLHPDYEYILWTDAKSREFIQTEYPWFLPTFDGYQHPIQRADTIRYFVLAHYGGVYIDLDQGCNRKLTSLLSFTAWVRRTIPTGISNDLMGSVPQHPFFLQVIESLQGADRKWVLPYITIMASTGPLFLSVVWKKWMSKHSNLDQTQWAGRVRVLMPDLAEGRPWSFFTSYGGSSWHGSDAKFIAWMGRNWMWLVLLGFMLASVLGVGMWWAYKKILQVEASRSGEHGKRMGEGRC